MYCIRCGTELPDDAAFCSECGTRQPKRHADRQGQPAGAAGVPQGYRYRLPSPATPGPDAGAHRERPAASAAAAILAVPIILLRIALSLAIPAFVIAGLIWGFGNAWDWTTEHALSWRNGGAGEEVAEAQADIGPPAAITRSTTATATASKPPATSGPSRTPSTSLVGASATVSPTKVADYSDCSAAESWFQKTSERVDAANGISGRQLRRELETDGQRRDAAATLRRLADEQATSRPPGAAARLNDLLVAILHNQQASVDAWGSTDFDELRQIADEEKRLKDEMAAEYDRVQRACFPNRPRLLDLTPTATASGRNAAVATKTLDYTDCEGLNEWYNATIERAAFSEAVLKRVMSGEISTRDQLARAGKTLSNIAAEQRNSRPPGAAVKLNEHYAQLFDAAGAKLRGDGDDPAGDFKVAVERLGPELDAEDKQVRRECFVQS